MNLELIEKIISNVPLELFVGIGGCIVAILTQLSKRLTKNIDPKFVAAIYAGLFGFGFVSFRNEGIDDLWSLFGTVWVLAFAGAVLIYELVNSIFKNDNEKLKKYESIDDLIFELVETERRAYLLRIDFEPFSLEYLTKGKRDETELVDHVSSLKEKLESELERIGSDCFKTGEK